jgi:hypothetical protein
MDAQRRHACNELHDVCQTRARETIALKTIRTGAVVAVLLALALVSASLRIASAQTPAPWAVEPPDGHLAPSRDGLIDKIKAELKLNGVQLERWAPVQAELRAALAARQKMSGRAFWPFYAFLSDRQKDLANVLLKPVVDDRWPSAEYRVEEISDHLGTYRVLMHGTIFRGTQRIRDRQGQPVDDTVPTTYYYPGSPIAGTIAKRRGILAAQGRKGRYGVVGLWAGSMACHKQAGETWRFFESDRNVIGIATDPKAFTLVSKCQPNIDIAFGEARLALAREPEASFDVLIIDTIYTGDGIQVQMLTKEAIELFLSKLTPDGVVLLHTSNRHLNLPEVLGTVLKVLPEGTAGIAALDYEAAGSWAQSLTENVIFAKSATALAPYRSSLRSVYELPANGLSAWTDANADIWAAWRKK